MPTTTEVRTPSDIQNLPLRRFADRLGGSAGVSWGAVFAGSAAGLVFQLWLSFLGVAIGASTVDPLQEINPMAGIGVGSAVWLALSIVASSYLGGWVAGRLSGAFGRVEAVLHGLTSWAVSNATAFMLVGTVFGGVISGITGMTRGAVTAAAGAASSAAQSPAATRMLDNAVGAAQAGARELMQEGREAVQSGEASAQARQAGDTAAKAVARTGWGVVILMFLGLIAGLMGASMAARVNTVYTSQK